MQDLLDKILQKATAILGDGIELLMFAKLLNIAGVIIIVLMIKRWLINRDTEGEYDD